MKILMCGSPNRGVALWRMQQVRKVFEQLGHTVEVIEAGREDYEGPQRYLEQVAEIIGYFEPDCLWTGRLDRTTIALFRQAEALGIKHKVLDMDDLLHEIPEHSVAKKAVESKVSGNLKMLDTLFSLADAITVTTPFLADYYDNWKGSGVPTFVCPNVIDTEVCKKRYVSPDMRLRVMMVYNLNRHGDYMGVLPAIKQAVDEGWAHLTLFGGFPKDFYGLDPADVRWVSPCPPDVYWGYLGSTGTDVIVNPMEPNNFNLAKSNIKWQEATAIGALCLTTKWGEMDVDGVEWTIEPDAAQEHWYAKLEELSKLKAEGTLSGEVERAREALDAGWTVTSPRAHELYAKVLDYVEHCDRTGGDDGSVVDLDVSRDGGGGGEGSRAGA